MTKDTDWQTRAQRAEAQVAALVELARRNRETITQMREYVRGQPAMNGWLAVDAIDTALTDTALRNAPPDLAAALAKEGE